MSKCHARATANTQPGNTSMRGGTHFLLQPLISCSVIDACETKLTELRTGTTRLLTTKVCGAHGHCIARSFEDFTCECEEGFTGDFCQEGTYRATRNMFTLTCSSLTRINSDSRGKVNTAELAFAQQKGEALNFYQLIFKKSDSMLT